MSDSPSNPGGGRPARPAIPPFRGPAAGGGAGGPVRPAVPPARSPLTPRDRPAVAGGLPPRPAVSPIAPSSSRPASRPATPARSPYVTPSGAQPAAPAAARPAALTPVVAQPEVLPAPVGEIVPSIALPSSDPLAGLDVIEAGPPREAGSSDADGSTPSAPRAGGEVATDWLSPEGALRGDFGDLVDHIPQRPSAQAPVFPTPPAPWPSLGAAAAGEAAGATSPDAGALADLDAGFEEVLGTSAGSAPDGAAAASATPAHQESETWTANASHMATPVEASAIPGALDDTAAESEMWAESYRSEADAIHGELDPAAADAGGAPASETALTPQSADPASYLASEWPDRPAMDPSTLPTPVMPSPAVLPGWDPAAAGQVPPARRPTDPLFDAVPQEDDAFGWGKTPQEAPAVPQAGADDWAFASAGTGGDLGRPVVTASSLSAAEALERVAAQLREGTLRADGFSPALGEAAALSAVLAALLGVDARWDVQR